MKTVADFGGDAAEISVKAFAGFILKRFLSEGLVENISSKIAGYAGKWISVNLGKWKKPETSDEACREALIVAVFTAFLNKITEKKYDLVLDYKAPADQNTIFGADALDPLTACSFDEHNVGNNELFNCLMEIVQQRMQQVELSERVQNEIRQHILEVIDIQFWRIIELHAERYKVYSKYSNSKLKGAETKARFAERHRARISGLYMQEMKLLPNQALALDDIYVEPDFVLHQDCWPEVDRGKLSTDDELKLKFRSNENGYGSYVFPHHIRDSQESDLYNGHVHEFLNKWVQDRIPLKGCDDHRLLVLLGQPGQGKTSCCKRLVYDVVAEKAVELVYFIRLKETKIFDHVHSPLEYLRQFVAKYVYKDRLQPGDDPLKGKKALLVLDGLDEATLNYGAASSQVNGLIGRLSDELYQGGDGYKPYEDMRIVMTSRTALVSMSELSYRKALVLQLLPFDQNLQSRWAEKFCHVVPYSKLRPELIAQIHEAKREETMEMLEQPVILFLIASTGIDLEDLDSRHDLYDRLFTELILRQIRGQDEIDTRTGQKTHTVLEHRGNTEQFKQRFRQVIAEIGLACFLDGRGCTNFESIKFIIDKLNAGTLFAGSAQPDAVEAVLDKILLTFYLDTTNTEQGQSVEFYHRTLMEYLAVEAIVDSLLRLCEQDGCGTDRHQQDVVLGLLFVFFGCAELSDRMGDDLEHRIMNLSEEERQKIGEKLIKSAQYLIEQEFMPKSKPDLRFIAKWGGEPILYESATWKEASRQVLLVYLSLVEITHGKTKINELFTKNELLTVSWHALVRDSVDEFNERLRFVRKHAFPRLKLKELDVASKAISPVYGFIDSMQSGRGFEHIIKNAIFSISNLEGDELLEDDLYLTNISTIGPIHCSFSGVDFSEGANLYRAILSHVDLSHSILIGAHFEDAVLIRSDLRSADLRDSFLRSSDLRFACLVDANLSRSYIRHTKFNGACLKNTNLSHVMLGSSNFNFASLEGAKLNEAEIHDTDLTCANIKDADFDGAIFTFYDQVNDDANDKAAYDRIIGMLMDRPEDERPKKGPASFETHIEHWKGIRSRVPKANMDYS